MVSQDFRKQLEGYGLTTANILSRRPDHPWLLQTYVWRVPAALRTEVGLSDVRSKTLPRGVDPVAALFSRGMRVHESPPSQFRSYGGVV